MHLGNSQHFCLAEHNHQQREGGTVHAGGKTAMGKDRKWLSMEILGTEEKPVSSDESCRNGCRDIARLHLCIRHSSSSGSHISVPAVFVPSFKTGGCAKLAWADLCVRAWEGACAGSRGGGHGVGAAASPQV